MSVRLLSIVSLHLCLFIVCIVLQLSVMPLSIFGQSVVVHVLFLLVLALLFLKEWQSSLLHLFFGMIIITQLSEIAILPITISYCMGVVVFLFLSDFLLKSRSAFIFTINALCALTLLIVMHQLILHTTVQIERALFSRDDLLFVVTSLIVHGIITSISAFGLLLIDQTLRKRELYVK